MESKENTLLQEEGNAVFSHTIDPRGCDLCERNFDKKLISVNAQIVAVTKANVAPGPLNTVGVH